MEKDEKSIAARMDALSRALKMLTKALQQPENEFTRDSAIKRFEYTFEISWKLMKSVLNYLGIFCNSPRQCIRQAFAAEIIDDTDKWLISLENRNRATHIYNENLAEEIYIFIEKFPPLVQHLIEKVEDELESE